jgi:hypothetical protein
LIAGMLSGSAVFAALAAAIIVNRQKQATKFSLEQQLTHGGEDELSLSRDFNVICIKDSSQGSASGRDEFVYNCKETTALQFYPSQKTESSQSFSQNTNWSQPCSSEHKVGTNDEKRFWTTPSSDCDSVLTSDDAALLSKHTPASRERKRWLPPWKRNQTRQRTEQINDEQYDMIEIDGEMRTVYLTPIDLL